MTLPASRRVSYAYDAASNLTGITDWLGKTLAYGYDAAGRLTSVERPNSVRTTLGYDAAGRVVSLNHDRGGAPVAHYAYTYDPTGNRTGVASAAGSESYTFDALDRLTRASYPNGDLAAYGYDAAGNRTSSTFNGATTTATFDAAGELTRNGATVYAYDGAGNLLGGGSSSLTWDALGRLGRATVAGQTTTYAYNGDGLRVGATTGSTTTPYLWDPQGELPELVDDGTNGYVETEATQEQIGRATNAASFPLADALGSVRTLTDSAGSVTGTAAYDAYGNVRSRSGATSSFGFTGQQTDPTGLVYLRTRYLDPSVGRFVSADTIRPSGPGTTGYGLYTYAGDNPTTLTDPSGQQPLIEYALNSARSVAGSVAVRLAGRCLAGAFAGLLQDFLFQEVFTGDYEFGSGSVENAVLGCVAGAASRGAGGPHDPAPPGGEPPPIKPGAAGGDTAGKPFPPRVRQQTLEENPNTCVYCRMETDSPQVDHSIPRSRGGNATPENAQTTCPHCNASKGARDYPVTPPPGYRGPWPPPHWRP
jgi:RHS repeat-associated protein